MRMDLRVVVALACGVACSTGASRSEIDDCISADTTDDPNTIELCETAWHHTRAEQVATHGAHYALGHKNDQNLLVWIGRALPTVEGARVLHYYGGMQRRHNDLKSAEVLLWRSLWLSRDLDPDRASNTALELLELAQSHEPPEVALWLGRLAWQQVQLAPASNTRPYAETSLVELLLDVGEIGTATRIAGGMSSTQHKGMRWLAEGEIAQAQGRFHIAASRAKAVVDLKDPLLGPLDGRIELAQARFDEGSIEDSRLAVLDAIEVTKTNGTDSIAVASRLAVVKAAVELASNKPDDAIATLQLAIDANPRDSGRVALFAMLGDVRARRADTSGAEAAWREAGDSIEDWRRSIPTTQLRSGLITRHRHALESWLESTASRGSVKETLDVAQRMLGRTLLDRIRQREANEPSVNAAIDDIVSRLATTREIASALPKNDILFEAKRDLVVIMQGVRSIWGIRRVRAAWSIDRIGSSADILELADRYRTKPDDVAVASQLGAALFPTATLPDNDQPLAVILDHQLADILLPGLRVNDQYLVQRAPIIELLAPALLFEEIRDGRWEQPVVIGNSRGDLDSAAAEARTVASVLGAQGYFETRATRDALMSAAHASALHIATHATTGHGRAAVVLSDLELTADDIVTSRIAPRLVVIATCRSESDDNPSGSLVAAFLAAGASGAVGSKRSLDDRAAASLMLAFYAAGGRDDPMRALASAQRAAIAAGRPASTWANIEFFGVGGWMESSRRRQ